MNTVIHHRRPTRFERFHYGVCYYPEHWDEATRRDDAQRMQAAGISLVRMGEFSWDLFEPTLGRFDFRLYDEVIPHLAAHGISTVLGTPTAAPPRWLTLAEPGLHRINHQGLRLEHGSRQHCCTANPRFREHSRRITGAMVERFGRHPAVIGWQTDNELNCHFSECHCQACQEGFRAFLTARYGTPAALNRAWGNAFWALSVGSFDEIVTPRDGQPTWPNPSARLDYIRFINHAVAAFQHDQVEIMRSGSPGRFIFHNGCFANIDYHGRFSQDLDALGIDIYPGFIHDPAARRRWHAWMCDRTRGYAGNFVVPELQSGPGGQGAYLHDTLEPGELRQQVWTSVARGADQVLHFRWRSCRFGAEEYWCGILDHDNVPRRRYQEVAQVGSELPRIGQELLGSHVYIDCAVASLPVEVLAADGAINHGLPNPHQMAETLHGVLYEAGHAVGSVHPGDDLDGLKLFAITNWASFDPAWIPGLTRWVEGGGTLLLAGRAGQRRLADNQVAPETFPGIFRPLAGLAVEEYSRINVDRGVELELEGRRLKAGLWLEHLALEGAEPLAYWRGRHHEGKVAAAVHRIGRGRVVYVGTYLTREVGEALLPILSRLAEVATQLPGLPAPVEVVQRRKGATTWWFLINHAWEPQRVPQAPPGLELISGTPRNAGPLELGPYGVAVIRVG